MSSSQAQSRTKTIWNVAKIVLALVLIGFVLSQTSIDEMVSVAKRASLVWLGLGILAFCGTTCFMTIRYWLLIGRQISLSRLLGVVIMQNAITNFVASGLGAASYVAMLRGEHQVKTGRGIVSLLSAKAGDLAAFFLALAAASYILWAQIEPLHEVVIILLAGMALALALFVLVISARRQLVSFTRLIQARLAAKHMTTFDKVLGAATTLMDFDPHKIWHILVPLVFYSCLVLILSSTWVFCIVQAFDIPLGIWPVVLVVSLTQLMSIIPIQVFGGLGVFEVTSIYIYGLFGVGHSEAAALAIGLRIILSMLSLMLLLYLPAESWIERKLAGTPS